LDQYPEYSLSSSLLQDAFQAQVVAFHERGAIWLIAGSHLKPTQLTP